MSTFSELLSMYFIILIFFPTWTALYFPPNLTKIFPPFSTHHSGIREPNDKHKRERTLCLPAWVSPAMLLPHSLWTSYGNCIFPSDPAVGFTEPWAEEGSASCTARPMFFSCGLPLLMGCTRRGRVILIPILTAQLALSSSPPRGDSPTAAAQPLAQREAGFGPTSKTSPMCPTS